MQLFYRYGTGQPQLKCCTHAALHKNIRVCCLCSYMQRSQVYGDTLGFSTGIIDTFNTTQTTIQLDIQAS